MIDEREIPTLDQIVEPPPEEDDDDIGRSLSLFAFTACAVAGCLVGAAATVIWFLVHR
jgi:hypothetical protein